MTTLLWFRGDLRLADHAAVHAAASHPGPVVPVFIWSPQEERCEATGAASRWWLHHSLDSLDASLRQRGSRLVLRCGRVEGELTRLLTETGAARLVASRRFEPQASKIDDRLERSLAKRGVTFERFNTSLLHDPEKVSTKSGGPFQVFTPFWRALEASLEISAPLAAPPRLEPPRTWPTSAALRDLDLLPAVDWAKGLRAQWRPGEHGAAERLEAFRSAALARYDSDRNRPELEGSSRLSPHLHFGEISPSRVYRAVIDAEATDADAAPSRGAMAFLRELAWREFAHYLLHHFPRLPETPLRAAFRRFPWRRSIRDWCAWQRGRTGYPLVDAGMRQLWHTGWMHNRVRMIAASFLVKHLLIDWRRGAKWFRDTLVDADLANNTLGWQWCAGCGADAAPYFRILNPIIQGRTFDPCGAYVRRWVPELASLPDRWIHEPWAAPAAALAKAGIVLGRTYPHPIVDHAEARQRALAAFAQVRHGGSS